MQKTVLITYDGPSFEAFIFDAIDKAIKLNKDNHPDPNPYGDFKWLVATCTGVPSSTLRIKSASGEIPGVIKFGRRVLYNKEAVIGWLNGQVRTLSSAAIREQDAEAQFTAQHQRRGGRKVA